MSAFGFTFEALYRLEVDELRDLARLIRGESYYPPRTKEALIRGVIIPFLRKAGKAPDNASKDEVMRLALIRVAKRLKVTCDEWETADTDWILRKAKQQWEDTFRSRFEDLDRSEQEEILKLAEEELEKRAQAMGLGFVPAAGIVISELSGFGIYLATTTGLGALSTAIGVTFPWAIYQGATTALGVVLGPIGWVLAGSVAVAGGAAFLAQWLKSRDNRLQVVVIAIIRAIGDNPYEWFGLTETASMQSVKSAYRAMMKTFHPDKLQQGLPEWIKHHFNQLLLQTRENYDRIQRYKEGERS
jgi:DnaJ-domain-containing protein 1